MIESVKPFAEWASAIMEILGVFLISFLALTAIAAALLRLSRRGREEKNFHRVREDLGRGILLGLEFLVAADIIHTVAVDLSFRTVGVLAVIVLIRTFLSFTLEVEISGQWPWQQKERERSGKDSEQPA